MQINHLPFQVRYYSHRMLQQHAFLFWNLSFKTLEFIQVSKLQPGVVLMGIKDFFSFNFRNMFSNSLVIHSMSQLHRPIVNV